MHELSAGELDLELLRMNDDPPPETLVRDVVRALRHAAEDDRIAAVLVDIDGLAGGGFTKLQDIAAAMREFRESGKPVVSYSRWYGQNGYLLASPGGRGVRPRLRRGGYPGQWAAGACTTPKCSGSSA